MTSLLIDIERLLRPPWRLLEHRPSGGLQSGHKWNDAPSSEVKHWALLISVSAWTPTPPPGPEINRPLVALHMSTGKYTPLAGRNFAESVKAASLMGFFVFIAPAKWTIPSMFFTAGAAVPGYALQS